MFAVIVEALVLAMTRHVPGAIAKRCTLA